MPNSNLSALTVCFENLDSVEMPAEYIGMLQIDKRSEHFAERFIISIDRKIDTVCLKWEFSESGASNLDRILGAGYIHDVRRIYDDGGLEEYCNVIWKLDEAKTPPHDNPYQRSKRNRFGDLFLEISEEAELDTIFPDDSINADGYFVPCPYRATAHKEGVQ
ncbi:hypothetical protein LJC34_05035 [Oscillospiraceae bacterium OttesenSCG-928-G22]|nr:hypothetical protein [Oscillospiraceae bacterium OttesenSCG-928-G22]